MKLTITQALQILKLRSPFAMADLKKAYRTAALNTHPDCGGSNAKFIRVDAAYDLLKSCASDFHKLDDDYWVNYWESRLEDLRKKFIKDWRNAFETAKSQNQGMWFSTCIERFARAYMRPRTEWFEGVLFPKSTPHVRDKYRQLLLEIAPNQRLREEWALKYYRLEFGFNTPYVFYLPPAKIHQTQEAV
ncbi:DnaJ domain-containing protein (plasmid) [Nostoc sp. UHCC 0302]|uniref:DnaJ domain-containing protein n=1 Tax=Nostoc sp. UHCC 0302 TaxID=3134896 RepID=UPI00311CC618